MESTQGEEEIKIAEDFRRQLQERFPAYAGDGDQGDVRNSMQSHLATLQNSVANLSPNPEKALDKLLNELEKTSLPNPEMNQSRTRSSGVSLKK